MKVFDREFSDPAKVLIPFSYLNDHFYRGDLVDLDSFDKYEVRAMIDFGFVRRIEED